MIDRRHFLLTSLAGAAPAHVLGSVAVEPAPPQQPPQPEPHTDVDLLLGLANELQVIYSVVEGYSQLMLQRMDEPDVLRRVPERLLQAAERLREMTWALRVRAKQARK